MKTRTHQTGGDYRNSSARSHIVFEGSEWSATASSRTSAMSRVGIVDERFQSYNIEMLEVTGGNFWKAYGNPTNGGAKPVQPSSSVPPG